MLNFISRFAISFVTTKAKLSIYEDPFPIQPEKTGEHERCVFPDILQDYTLSVAFNDIKNHN